MIDAQLLDTQRAFDSVAVDYDGPTGNNTLIQWMRVRLWRAVQAAVPTGGRLLDLGCGTGLDAAYFAGVGYRVLATDWSPQMVARTHGRAQAESLQDRLTVRQVGSHQLDQLDGEQFDGIYSDLGPLNCVPDLGAVARECARLLAPGGHMVLSVIGRICPWETAYYLARGQFGRARLRGARRMVPVGLNGETVWTSYFTPREFASAFAPHFTTTSYRGLLLFLPPPYLAGAYERHSRVGATLGWLDDRLGALPLLRDAGDHFLIVLTRRD